jgi:type II secretory pathway component PulF
MPKFNYSVKSQPGQVITGDIEAQTQQEAVNKLIQMGYFPLSVRPQDVSFENKKFYAKKISKRQIAIFTRQLANLSESGVTIVNALAVIVAQSSNKYLKAVLSDAARKIKDGKSLSESLADYPQVFPQIYTSIIYSGEASGNLGEVIRRLAEFLENEDEFRSNLIASLTYPFFIVLVGSLTLLVLMGFVVPRLVKMFEDMGQVLPLPTTILIKISLFIQNYWWLIGALIFIFIFLLKRTQNSPQGKVTWDAFKLRLPFFGQIILKTEISRLMRTLSLLISSGIAIVSSLGAVLPVINNSILKAEIQKFKEQITEGLSFSQCLQNSKLFPLFVTNIVAVGEEGGKLEKSLLSIAEQYEKEVDRSLKGFVRMLEPAIILTIGLIVGFIVLSMLLPIFQINLIAG